MDLLYNLFVKEVVEESVRGQNDDIPDLQREAAGGSVAGREGRKGPGTGEMMGQCVSEREGRKEGGTVDRRNGIMAYPSP